MGVAVEGKSAELAREQAYFDVAAKHRERRLATLAEVGDSAANPSAAAHLRRYARSAREAITAAGAAVAFGRVDGEPAEYPDDDTGETLYIGRQLISDDRSDVLVVNWQAPAAAAYFEATPADPRGLRRKRTFDCQGNTIRDFTDVVFGEIEATVDAFLLRELARGRTGEMRDIVATIQAAQYEVIRAPLAQLTIIEGGPGTGKTAVALHRVSWLLYHHRDRFRADEVLVVGPHPTFMRYIDQVLPGLGEGAVALRDLSQLAPQVSGGRPEPAEVSRLKGEARMADLLARALAARIGAPEPAERLLVGGRFLTLPGAEITEAVAACRDVNAPYARRRQLLRDRLIRLVTDRGAAEPAAREAVGNLLERLWPQQSAAGFLRDLFGSRRRLQVAGGIEFRTEELALLYRRGTDRVSTETWSAADLPLLDEVEHLLHGGTRQYAHVVVDEAQDLSPMQLRSLARRCPTGSMTLVGDLAQSTGPWARDHWDEVTAHLPTTQPVVVAPLRYGYRVPRQVYELAARLLPVAAPHTEPPEVVRDGPEPPRIHRVSRADRANRVAEVAARRAAERQFVGIVCPPRCRREVEAALHAAGHEWSSAAQGELGSAINLVSPQEAKGLEFDAVVVIEPEQIVTGDPRGHRLLYVALTRTTRLLDIVCVGEPLPLSQPATPPEEPPPAAPDGYRDQQVRRLAAHLADRLRSAAPPEAWPQVLRELERLLQRPE